ncbi:MAG: hypothetical protein WC533_01245 [Candidatus Pacearchaeota archaeon]
MAVVKSFAYRERVIYSDACKGILERFLTFNDNERKLAEQTEAYKEAERCFNSFEDIMQEVMFGKGITGKFREYLARRSERQSQHY